MTRLLNASQKFLKVVHEFGYPDCTMRQLATDEFYQQVVWNLLKDDIPLNFMNEVMGFIKSHQWP